MSCYHPNLMMGLKSGVDEHFPIFLGAAHDSDLEQIRLDRVSDSETYHYLVPCGRCRGCRLDKGRQNADKMLLEFELHNRQALFITYTYESLNDNMIKCSDGCYRPTLVKKHMQDYHKRLRRHFGDKRLRMFYAGEYGDKTFRPHYHEILYGVTFDDFYMIPWSTDPETGFEVFRCPEIENIWERGNVIVAPASYATFSYVARYVLKKQYGSDSNFYLGRLPPFCQSSLKPGLGSGFFDNFDFEFGKVSLNDGNGVHDVSIPRSVLDKLQLTHPELYDNIKTNKRIFAEARTDLICGEIDIPYFDYLRSQELSLIRKTKQLDRKDKKL